MNLLTKHIDTSIFSTNDYLGEISLGRIYVKWFKKLFSSEVVNGLCVDPDLYIVELGKNGFNVSILGTYRTINYPKKDKDNPEQIQQNTEFREDWEYITMLDGKMLIGIREEAFRIVYHQDIPRGTIQKIIDLYINLNDQLSKHQDNIY